MSVLRKKVTVYFILFTYYDYVILLIISGFNVLGTYYIVNSY